jgi:hypothetical protein
LELPICIVGHVRRQRYCSHAQHQFYDPASWEPPCVALPSGCRRKDDSIRSAHLAAWLTATVSSNASNSRSFDQRRRP